MLQTIPRAVNPCGSRTPPPVMDRIDGKVPQATILQGDADEPVRYVEVPRKAASADEWLQMQTPSLTNAGVGGDKLN
jgi:hypothetical protein